MHVYPEDISSAELTRCASNYYVCQVGLNIIKLMKKTMTNINII